MNERISPGHAKQRGFIDKHKPHVILFASVLFLMEIAQMKITLQDCERFYSLLKAIEPINSSWPASLIKSFAFDPFRLMRGLDYMELHARNVAQNPSDCNTMRFLQLAVESLIEDTA